MEDMVVKEEIVVETTGANEVVASAPEDIHTHLKQGKIFFEEASYDKAIKEFEAIIKTAPGNIEARVWIRKAKDELARPLTETVTEGEEQATGGKVKECLWMKMGMVSYRLCNNNYDCLTCEFDQQMQEKMAKGDADEMESVQKKFDQLPGSERICRYALKGDVSHRICSRAFQCATCEFDQMMDDELQKKIAKLATRRETMQKRAEVKK